MKTKEEIIKMYDNVWDEYRSVCMQYKATKTDYLLYRQENYLKGFCDALEIVLNAEPIEECK